MRYSSPTTSVSRLACATIVGQRVDIVASIRVMARQQRTATACRAAVSNRRGQRRMFCVRLASVAARAHRFGISRGARALCSRRMR
eukprot:3936234-Rhodomonas_salina.1